MHKAASTPSACGGGRSVLHQPPRVLQTSLPLRARVQKVVAKPHTKAKAVPRAQPHPGANATGWAEYWKPRVPLQARVLNDAHSWRTYHVRLYVFAGQLGSTLLLSVPRSAQPPQAWFRLKVLSPYAMAVAASAVALARSEYTVSAVWPVHTALGTPVRLQVVSVVPMPWNTGTAQIWNSDAPGPVNWNDWHVNRGSGGLGGARAFCSTLDAQMATTASSEVFHRRHAGRTRRAHPSARC